MSQMGFSGSGAEPVQRRVALEVPVAIEVGGLPYAVMMATPSALEDYAIGFALNEGLVDEASQITQIAVEEVPRGWALRITLPAEFEERVRQRSRTRVSESSCGLCGMDSIEQVLRPLPVIGQRLTVSKSAIGRAIEDLWNHQSLGQETGAAHAAAMYSPDGELICIREDVGRHNALDKLIGALTLSGISPASGFILLSARCSYELVEKTVRFGCPVLVTISAPTSLAIEAAESAGLSLVSLARSDSALVVCDSAGNISLSD